MICTVVELQKKLPVFRAGTWSLATDCRVSLYGHDAKTMKNFTLHFDMDDQCDTLDRAGLVRCGFQSRNTPITSILQSRMTVYQIQQI